MRRIRERLLIRSFLLPFATALWLGIAGCTTWTEPDLPVEQLMVQERPQKLRVNLADGSQPELESPRLVADSLRGVNSTNPTTGELTWISIPLSSIKSVEVQRTDGLKTAAFVGVGVLVIGGIAILASSGEEDPPPPPQPPGPNSPDPCANQPYSCPYVYSWDGVDWRLDSGTFGGAFLKPLARTDVDLLEHARAEDGRLRLRLADELPETHHVDALNLLVVDHVPGTEVIPDGTGVLHGTGALSAPIAAIDDHGRNALAAVLSVDGWGWESSPTGRDPSVATDTRSMLELEFNRLPDAPEATLVVHGNNTLWSSWLMGEFVAANGPGSDAWYAVMNADPDSARALGEVFARDAFLTVSVLTVHGWETRGLVWEAGPEIAKRQALRLDLAGVEGETVRVRLESAPLFWNLDQVAIDFSAPSSPEALVVEPDRATMENGGRDVRAVLASVDGNELILETGDAAELSFQVPPVADGMARSYLIATSGWYQIHVPESDAPPRAELANLGTEVGAVSRLSVARLNEALAALQAAGVEEWSRVGEMCRSSAATR